MGNWLLNMDIAYVGSMALYLFTSEGIIKRTFGVNHPSKFPAQKLCNQTVIFGSTHPGQLNHPSPCPSIYRCVLDYSTPTCKDARIFALRQPYEDAELSWAEQVTKRFAASAIQRTVAVKAAKICCDARSTTSVKQVRMISPSIQDHGRTNCPPIALSWGESE